MAAPATSKPFTYEIPVYPFVEKFLSAQYDTAPFMLSGTGSGYGSNPYASFLYASLARYGYQDDELPRKYARLTARLTVGISAWVVRHGAGAKLTPAKISAFNDFVGQLFYEKLTEEVALRTSFGAGLRQSAQRFLDRYGITEEELSIDTVLRYYARYYRRRMGRVGLTDGCPDSPPKTGVILSHERDHPVGQMESRWRTVA